MTENLLGMCDTGRTLSEDPMTRTKSVTLMSSCSEEWNSKGRPSPKKTISGFITLWIRPPVLAAALATLREPRLRRARNVFEGAIVSLRVVFDTSLLETASAEAVDEEAMEGASLTTPVLSPLVALGVGAVGGGKSLQHLGQRGTVWFIIASRISSPGTRWWHVVQLAVENEPRNKHMVRQGRTSFSQMTIRFQKIKQSAK